MSATNELIQTVYEFRSLLRYLGENYPKILKEWSNGPQQATTTHWTPTTLAEGEHIKTTGRESNILDLKHKPFVNEPVDYVRMDLPSVNMYRRGFRMARRTRKEMARAIRTDPIYLK